MWTIPILMLAAAAAVIWNRYREADDVVVPRSRRPAANGRDSGADGLWPIGHGDGGGGDAGCDGGAEGGGGGGSDCG